MYLHFIIIIIIFCCLNSFNITIINIVLIKAIYIIIYKNRCFQCKNI